MDEWEAEGDSEREAESKRSLFLDGEGVDHISLFPKGFLGVIKEIS